MSKYNNYLTQEEKEIIFKLNSEGYTNLYISKQLGRSSSTIDRFVKRNGLQSSVHTNRTRKFNNGDIELIIQLYTSGMTTYEIYATNPELYVCPENIQRILRQRDLIRKSGYRNIFNENYFSKIDTPTKAYYLGFIYADGNVFEYKNGEKSNLVQLSQHSKDKYILEKFLLEIEKEKKISIDKKGVCSLAISSNTMVDDLIKLGVVPSKTHVLNTLPDIPKEYMSDFIRGLFDGDGTVYTSKGKTHVSFYGTYDLLTCLQDYLCTTYDFVKTKIIKKYQLDGITESVSMYCLSRQDIDKFKSLIYYNDDVVCLERKRNKFIN